MSEAALVDPVAPPRGRVHLARRLLQNPAGVGSAAFLLLLVLSAILAPLIAPKDPNRADVGSAFAPISPDNLLGADAAGHDILSRLIFATQFSLAGAALALVVAVLLGVVGGLIAGYYGGWFDNVASWLTGLLMALPGIVILLAARAVLGPSLWLSMAIFGVLLSPAFYRLVYAAVTAVRSELYVDAARVAGLSDFRIIGRHVLSVVRAPVIIQAAMISGIAIAVQSGLEFLGFGDMSIPTWGSMLNEGFDNIYRAPLLIVWPALAIGLACIALVLLGNAMRDELERTGPRRRRGKRTVAAATAPDVAPIAHADDDRAARIAAEPLLTVRGLKVGYDQQDGSVTQVVHGIDLDIRKGEVHGLIGESGSGKTQTAFSVLGLLPSGGRVTAGSIDFGGTALAGAGEGVYKSVRGKRIAYVPQEPMSNLDASYTIGSQLVEPMRVVLGLSKKDATERALALLARVGLPDPQKTFRSYPHEISGGQAQRVLIAGAVSCDPELLIADEPTTALDVTVQAEVLDLLRDLQAEFGMAMLLVTHNFGVVADLCDRVSVMQSGRIVETGPVRTIFNGAEHPYTQALLDAILEDGEPRGALAPRKEVSA